MMVMPATMAVTTITKLVTWTTMTMVMMIVTITKTTQQVKERHYHAPHRHGPKAPGVHVHIARLPFVHAETRYDLLYASDSIFASRLFKQTVHIFYILG